MKCAICDSELRVQWSDTHGVGACIECGLPYTVLHYDDKRERVEKPPEVAVRDCWMPVGVAYWNETRQRVFPAAFDMGFNSGREHTYSGASHSDIEAWNAWLDAHQELLPKAEKGGGDAIG